MVALNTTRLQEKYGAYLEGLGDQLRTIADQMSGIASGEDLHNLGRRLELCQELTRAIINKWQTSVIEFAAVEDWNDNECAFHLGDYKPSGCSVCRAALSTRQPILEVA